MANYRGDHLWKGITSLFVVLTGTTSSFAATGGDPNAASKPALDLSNLNMSTIQEILTRVYTLLAEYGLKIIGSVLIFIIGRWVARLIAGLVGKAMARAKIDVTLVRFVDSLCYLVLLTFVVIAALSNLGVHTASFVAVVGAAGLAVGLALQGSLSNFASGVLMLVFKPIRVGDYVEAGGAQGSVKEIGIFTTIMNSPDNVRIIVPNAQITGGTIKNYTVNGTRRLDMVFSVSYEDNLRKARQVIEQVLAAESRILPDPAPVVAVSTLADSSVNFIVRPWVRVADYWPTHFDLTEKIKVALEENGLTIPFPQRDVHIRQGSFASGGN